MVENSELVKKSDEYMILEIIANEGIDADYDTRAAKTEIEDLIQPLLSERQSKAEYQINQFKIKGKLVER